MKCSLTAASLLLGILVTTYSYAGPAASPASYSGPAPADQGGLYATIHGGATWLEDVSALGASLSFDAGWSVFGAVGWDSGHGFAAELELGFAQSDFDDARYSGRTFNVDGEFRQVPAFANALYQLDLGDKISVYVGGGAGILWSEAELESLDSVPAGLGRDEWNFAVQGKAGVAYKINEAASFNLGYRYLYGFDSFADLDDGHGSILEGGFTIRF